MEIKYRYEINFKHEEINAPRAHLSGEVLAGSAPMGAHRAFLHAREHCGNRAMFDRVKEFFLTLKEVKE